MSNKVESNFGVSVMALIAVCVLVLIINMLLGTLHKSASADMSEAGVVDRIAPVAQLNTGAPMAPPAAPAAAAPAAARSGQDVYRSSCFACHDTGAAGAPKMGDVAAWGPFVEKGIDGMLQNAITGVNAMPPRGTCANCSDDELRSSIQYMLDAM